MSEEPKCQHPQSSTLQQAGAAPSRQQTESASDPAAFYRARTAVDREPHTPTTTYLSPSASRQSAGLNTPSEASSASLQTNFPASPSATGTTFRRISPADWLKREHEALKQRLQHLPYPGDRRPRLPTAADFPHALQVQIIPPFFEEHIEHVVVLLHQYGGSESSLNLARKLHKQQPETSFVLLPRIEAMSTPKSGYHWADTTGDWDGPFLNSVGILTDKILFPLIEACGFLPREIVLMGHGQGGKAVLGTAALWEDVELGGAVSIGGPLPSYVQPTFAEKIKTPALMIWGTSGDRTPVSLERIRSRFVCVDDSIFSGAHDTLPDTDESMKPLAEFLSHRLQREEWKRQAIISLDGGGVRGYGSLLILQNLMNKVGDEEKRRDAEEGKTSKTDSSFAPGLYKPIDPKMPDDPDIWGSSEGSLNRDTRSPGQEVASNIEGLPNSSLFLPCHYFNYAAGTSTGGLISIMLSRLRMTVDDCIAEYETLGQKIFGHPRPLAFGAVMWHKFDYKVLENAIRDVTARHSEKSEEYGSELIFPSHKDLCRTLVMAYWRNMSQKQGTVSDSFASSVPVNSSNGTMLTSESPQAEHNKSDAPYLFRTYYTPPPEKNQKKTKQRQTTARNHGPPPRLPIWQIGRATSAAPKYFPPIEIRKGVEHYVRFKDGGFGCNNPSEEAYYDIVHKHGGFSKAVGLFISIGTGVTPLELFAKKRGNVRNALANMRAAHKHPSRTLHAHDTMARISHGDDKDIFPYYRFAGGERLGEVKLDEWKSHRLPRLMNKNTEHGCKTLRKMHDAIDTYLNRPDVQRDLKECAALLVKRRRYRARDASAWDRYASASFYECSLPGCQKVRYNTAQHYEDHLKKEHRLALADQSLEEAMKKSRRCWIYRNT